MSDISDLMHKCRLARDFLFSAKNERSEAFLLIGLEVEEVSVMVWHRVSKHLNNNEYRCAADFLNDVEPIRTALLKGSARPSKTISKHVESVFRCVHDMTSLTPPTRGESHSCCREPCIHVVDFLKGANVTNIMSEFHRRGEAYGLLSANIVKDKQPSSSSDHETAAVMGEIKTENSSVLKCVKKLGKNNDFTEHDVFHGVRVVSGSTIGVTDSVRYLAFITVVVGRGRSAIACSVQLQDESFRDAAAAARAHDLASIRASGPQACRLQPRTAAGAAVGEDDSCLLNFNISEYAEEDLRAFSQWDVVLRRGLAEVRQWPGPQSCDFSFLLFAPKEIPKVLTISGGEKEQSPATSSPQIKRPLLGECATSSMDDVVMPSEPDTKKTKLSETSQCSATDNICNVAHDHA